MYGSIIYQRIHTLFILIKYNFVLFLFITKSVCDNTNTVISSNKKRILCNYLFPHHQYFCLLHQQFESFRQAFVLVICRPKLRNIVVLSTVVVVTVQPIIFFVSRTRKIREILIYYFNITHQI